MELALLNIEGKETGKKIDLKDSIFSIEPNDHAIYLDVKQHLANKRQGTHKTKERAEVAGSTKKIKRQKGTGTARAGAITSPLFRGGGNTFGPRPRNYHFKLNKKVKRLARKSALSYKAKNNQLLVLDNLNFDSPRTKDYISMTTNLKINEKKTLVVLPEQNKNVYLSSRNLKNNKVIIVSELTTYDIMNASTVLFVESSLDMLQNKILN